MTAKHTPGPWSVVYYGDGNSLVIHDARGDWRVCFMATPGNGGGMGGIEANARLIAAAPDLLEALEDLFVNGEAGVQVIFGGNPIACERLEAKCRAAIAKATSSCGENG